jgi:hypothetical protein
MAEKKLVNAREITIDLAGDWNAMIKAFGGSFGSNR